MKKITLIILVFLISLIVFEFYLNFSPFSNGISPVEYDKDIGMWHKKDFSAYIIKNCYKNKYFFDTEGRIQNNYEYEDTKKDIILLGDSQIEALMVDNNYIIHNSLYKKLTGRFNILNYALSGTGASQQLEILKAKVDLGNIDTLIHFVFLENDLNDADPNNFNGTNRPKVHIKFTTLNEYIVIKPAANNIKEKIRDLLGNFEFYVYLKKTIYFYKNIFTFTTKEKLQEKAVKKYELSNEEYKWQQIEGAIYQINQIALKNQFKYQVVIYSTYEFRDNYTLKRQRLENFLNKQNIKSTNIVPFLHKLKQTQTQTLSFQCDSHWNKETHKELASFLSTKIN